MTKKLTKLTIATKDGMYVPGRTLVPPSGGEKYPIYSLKDELEDKAFLPYWQAFFGTGKPNERLQSNPRRSVRQNGKIAEAQNFRRMQGAYMKSRLHFFDVAKHNTGLRWWFSDTQRICLHHLIMSNYYLDDAGTTEEEILSQNYASDRQMMRLLKTAIEIGSLESDPMKDDKRKTIFYPSRGLVSDTDNLFSSRDPEAMGIFPHLRQMLVEAFGPSQERDERYTMDDYLRDTEEFKALVEEVLNRV